MTRRGRNERVSEQITYKVQYSTVKAALINMLILAMDQMTVCQVKGVARSDDNTTNNYHSTLHLVINW